MNRILTTLLCTVVFMCYFSTISAQHKYGKVTKEELEMTRYEKDTTASALIMLKKGDVRFTYNENDGYQFEYELQYSIKILTQDGLDWCNQEIHYYQIDRNSKEEIKALSGFTYNLEEDKIEKIKLGKDNIFDEELGDQHKVRKFSMPAAKVGSIIEFKYKIISNLFYDLRPFTFQADSPIEYVTFEAIIPEFFNYNSELKGYERPTHKRETVNSSFNIRYRDYNGNMRVEPYRFNAEKYSFEGSDMPALSKESMVWSQSDYMTMFNFELRSIQFPYQKLYTYTTSWNDLDEKLKENSYFGGNLNKKGLFKDLVTPEEPSIAKAIEILDIVKNQVSWNEKRGIYPDNLKKAMNDGSGSSPEMNFLLVNALKASGFDAYPVLLSTRDNGSIPFTYPSLSSFNNVIAAIKLDDKYYYADASDTYGNWDILPYRDLVLQARVFKPARSEWVNLTPLAVSNESLRSFCVFEDGKLVVKSQCIKSGMSAYNFRKKYFASDNKEEMIEEMFKLESAHMDSFNVQKLENPYEPVKIQLIQSYDKPLGSDHIYINPLPYIFQSINPFSKETRAYPINFDETLTYQQTVSIKIPDGYEVEELPQAEKIVLNENDLTLLYNLQVQGNAINVIYKFTLTKLLFLPDQYENLKDTFAKVIAKNKEQIVLKKVKADI